MQTLRRPLSAALLLGLALLLLMGTPARAERSLEQVSGASPTGSYTDYAGVSADGRHVVFVTSKQLDPVDTDSQIDVYDNVNGVNTLVSVGPSGGNGPRPASFDFVSLDGAVVIFETEEPLTALDRDNGRDVYTRAGGTTALVSTGGSGAYDAFYEGASADGTKVFFGTHERLTASDTDTYFDSYMHTGTTSTLMTTGPSGGNGSFPAEFAGASTDGTHMFFQTAEPLVDADTDSQMDVYERTGSTTTLVSTGPSGGNGSLPATYDGCSADGTKVFFSTEEPLVSADSGSGEDIYKRAAGATSLMTNGGIGAVEEYAANSSDGTHVYYETQGKATAADVDSFMDVYDSNDGTVTLVSPGRTDPFGATNAYFLGAATDGSHVFFRSEEALVSGDSDNTQDIYDTVGGAVTLASVGPAGGNASVTAIYAGNSQDGSRLFFETYESLVSSDTDTRTDVYERSAGTTTLLTAGTGGGNGAVDAHFRGATPDGSRVLFRTGEPLASSDTDASNDVYASSLPGQIVIVKDAVPDSPQDFTFTIGGGLSLGLQAPPGQTTFQLDDDSDPALSSTQTFTSVPAGSGYSVTESPAAGWDPGGASCDNGSPATNIRVDPGHTTTCTFTNNKRGQIVVVADSQPDDGQDFSFTSVGGLSPASFELDDDGDPTLSNTQTFSDVVPGSGYGVAETAIPGGWVLADASCSNGSPVTDIDVAPGETVTCTFTNRKRGQVVIVKDTQPDNAQNFTFTASGGLTPTSFQLDDDTDGTLPNTFTFNNVVPALYSVTEANPMGWQQASATCDDGSPVTSIDVGPGETVTCTFVNTSRGTIVAVLDSQPNDPQDFSFTTNGGLSPSSFSLDDDSDPTLSNARSFTGLNPGGGYGVQQAGTPAGWDVTSASCSDGSKVNDIRLSNGEIVTCTFTNRKHGELVVVEDSLPDDPQDFSFAAGGGLSPSSFSLDDDNDSDLTLARTQLFYNLQAKNGYSLAQTVPSGWIASSPTCSNGSPVTNIDIPPGQAVTCTFVNTKRARITIVKDAQPDDAQNFVFGTSGGLSPASFQLDDDSDGTVSNTRTFDDVPPGGGYGVSEAVPGGWDQSSATCSDGSPVTNIDAGPGEQITCTFVNKQRGSITIVKDAQPDDAQDFSFTSGGGLSPASFQLDDDSDGALANTHTFADVPAAAGYSVTEAAASGWTESSSCSDGSTVSNVDVAPGEDVTCTFTNKQNGTIVVVKDAQPNDPQDFSFTAGGGLEPTSFQLDDDSDNTLSSSRSFNDVTPGSGYSLDETVPPGWDLTTASCDDGSPVSDIDVGIGETVICTFTNRKRGRIVVVKDAAPDNPQDFSFSAGGGLSPASFQLDDDSDGTLSHTRTFSDVVPDGGYSVTETVPAGWGQESATCSDGSHPSGIDVEAGETVTCTFVNVHGYTRPRGATPFRASLVPAFRDCASATLTHGAPLASPSCKPPVQTSAYLTVGSPDANGQAPNMTGTLRAAVVPGNSSTPADEADVQITTTVTDVRNKSDLSDYAGALSAVQALRVTDRYNGSTLDDPATVLDFSFSVTIPCTATSSLATGSTCTLTTTADTLTPGMAVESKRAIWQLGDLQVFDGGADGDPATPGNTLFARQGVFVP